MILRTNAHPKGIDLGPRRDLETSMMTPIGVESTGSGGWNRNMAGLFEPGRRPKPEPVEPKPPRPVGRPRVENPSPNALRLRAARAKVPA